MLPFFQWKDERKKSYAEVTKSCSENKSICKIMQMGKWTVYVRLYGRVRNHAVCDVSLVKTSVSKA